MPADTFPNFAALSAEMKEGQDFHIRTSEGSDRRVLIIAPHAGKIEPGTSELSEAIAGDLFSSYLLEGALSKGNHNLHITSHRFDEPQAIAALAQCSFAVGIHGRSERGDPSSTWLGGLDKELIDLLETHLAAAGFETKTNGHPFPAEEPKNVCNRGQSGKGAQLELPPDLRDELKNNSDRMKSFADAVRAAITEHLETTTPPA